MKMRKKWIGLSDEELEIKKIKAATFKERRERGLAKTAKALNAKRQRHLKLIESLWSSECFQNRKKRNEKQKLKAARREKLKLPSQPLERVVGCELDEQAKALGVYTEQYAKLSRKKRKSINRKALKAVK